ncbi:aldo/keto reductase [Methanobrevibacter acididurans]|uniref:aldo/keto reductase n=1 Tax=Methanobrevibacter acididurans TaxID=120963 RepID=UPI0038FCD8E4
MQYRELGKTGEKVSQIGFGLMRLPVLNGDNTKIDTKKASEMLSYGIDNGINILDTGFDYHGNCLDENGGASEPFLSEFLDMGYREKVLISSKLPLYPINKKEDLDYYFNKQLERLNTDCIDIYMLHGIKTNLWGKLMFTGYLNEFLDNLLSEGKVKHIGFSHHGDYQLFQKVMNYYDKWEVVLTQMNYLDTQYKSGKKTIDYVGDNGIGNMIMEPLRGGTLVNNIPPKVQELMNTSDNIKSPIEWGLGYLWNMPHINCVLSEMSTLEQVKTNIEIANKAKPGYFTEEDNKILKKIINEFRHSSEILCTYCNYCMPCSHGVNIPKCFHEYNESKVFDKPDKISNQYFDVITEKSRADQCKNCAQCLEECPQDIDIMTELHKVEDYFKNTKH